MLFTALIVSLGYLWFNSKFPTSIPVTFIWESPPPHGDFFFPLGNKIYFLKKRFGFSLISTAKVMFSNSKFSHLKSVLGRKTSFNVCMYGRSRSSKQEVCVYCYLLWLDCFLSNTGCPLQFACWTLLRYGPRSFLRFVRLIAWERYVAIGKRIDYKVVVTKSLIKTCQ